MRTVGQIGRLRDRVSIATPTRTDDGEGGSVVTATTATPTRLPAEVRTLTARERFQAASSEVEVTHVVTLRAHPGVGPQTRLLWGARVLELVGVPIEHEHGRWLECPCVERYR